MTLMIVIRVTYWDMGGDMALSCVALHCTVK